MEDKENKNEDHEKKNAENKEGKDDVESKLGESQDVEGSEEKVVEEYGKRWFFWKRSDKRSDQ